MLQTLDTVDTAKIVGTIDNRNTVDILYTADTIDTRNSEEMLIRRIVKWVCTREDFCKF